MKSRRYAPLDPPQVYSLLTWVVSLFVGAAINVLALTFLEYFVSAYASGFLYLLIPVAFVLLPLFLASFVTDTGPTKIIMPPSYIQLLTMSWFVAIVPLRATSWLIPDTGSAIVSVLLALMGAAIDDLVTPAVLGYAYGPSRLPVQCLVGQGSVTEIQDRIMVDAHRRIIGLQKNITKVEQGVLLRTDKSRQYQIFVMLTKGQADDETEITIGSFSEEQYHIAVSDATRELLREKSLYITAILVRLQVDYPTFS